MARVVDCYSPVRLTASLVLGLGTALTACTAPEDALAPGGISAAVSADAPVPVYQVLAFDVPASMGDFTSVFGVNNHGTLTGSYAAPDGSGHGFIYRDGSFTDVAVPQAGPTFKGFLGAINEDEVALGSYADAAELEHVFLYNRRGQMTFLPDPVPGALATDASGLNTRGTIVGFVVDANGVQHGFIQEGGVVTLYDHPGGNRTRLFSINDRGQIAGQYFGPGNIRHGFILHDDMLTPIDVPGSTGTAATAVNDLGQVVGFYRAPDFTVHGFLLDRGRFITIDFPGSSDTRLTAISDLGMIAGTYDFFSRGMIAVPVTP